MTISKSLLRVAVFDCMQNAQDRPEGPSLQHLPNSPNQPALVHIRPSITGIRHTCRATAGGMAGEHLASQLSTMAPLSATMRSRLLPEWRRKRYTSGGSGGAM